MLTLWCLFAFVTATFAATHEYNFTVLWIDANPDGVFTRRVLAINGAYPAPTIHITRGDRLVLHLTNGLPSHNTSLHFHGLFQEGSNLMDGPEMVTQCPIPPGSTLTYNFTVDSQHGTYWYHSHSGAQYGDGLRGVLVVHEKKEPFAYDEEVVVSISEWYHRETSDLKHDFLSRFNPTGSEPIPQNVLFNGSRNVTWAVAVNTTYLMRVVNTGLFLSQYLYIEGHEMTVVEADGIYVEPYTTDMLYLTVAQRYSVLVKTKQASDKNFAIVQVMDEEMLDSVPADLETRGVNYMVYDSNLSLPHALARKLSAFNDADLRPRDPEELLADPDYFIVLDVIMDNLGDGVQYSFFNNITYVAPRVPTLYSVLSAPEELVNNAAIYGSNTNAFVLQKDEVVEIVVNNKDDGRHPFHLHGHVFQIVAKSPAFDEPTAYNESAHESLPEYPMRRDTILVESNGYMVLRFRADNPGVWFFHCHVDWHLEQGLAITLIEAPEELRSQQGAILENHLEVCAAARIPTRGNAAGNAVAWLDLAGENVQPQPLPEGFTLKGYVALFISTLVGLYGIYSIYVFGIEDVKGDTENLQATLRAILSEHGGARVPPYGTRGSGSFDVGTST
ncbi:hypothetical protein BABINDRAFT_61782 [Babjeviella inositovora NRRL Y-12698]|uniref:Ferroxidase n=1 Tax=Babjeviella inositovora NRRL Y-12698 TaxID=984486 RepID=A0A1E3QU44_9ASCO|nr:uncharacterized protein BABINDRAFT_61782 [Babjeviella inositovora NRRL Y-12698]ODQ80447.1 hypothetical protein BABINDRAFT_61782 [Babjeviella inositovora NRRL Y-12698]